MSHEGFPTSQPSEVIIQPDGSLNEALLGERYGIGVEEAGQEVTFGSYTGTVAQMLSDERCPVGGMVQSAYQEKGIDGVAEKLKTLSQLDPRFSVKIAPETLQREQVKKN
jgi:hypothetical protein